MQGGHQLFNIVGESYRMEVSVSVLYDWSFKRSG